MVWMLMLVRVCGVVCERGVARVALLRFPSSFGVWVSVWVLMLVRVCGVVCEGGVARVALLRFIWAIIQESRLFIHFHFRGFHFWPGCIIF